MILTHVCFQSMDIQTTDHYCEKPYWLLESQRGSIQMILAQIKFDRRISAAGYDYKYIICSKKSPIPFQMMVVQTRSDPIVV